MSQNPRLVDRLKGLCEPVARAVRRGHQAQILEIVSEIRALFRSSPRKERTRRAAEIGATLEGILGFALASADGNARVGFIRSEPRALRILHVLARADRRRMLQRAEVVPVRIIDLSRLAKVNHVEVQNIVENMQELSLLRAYEVPPVSVSIMAEGVMQLEAMLPGWQVMKVGATNPLRS